MSPREHRSYPYPRRAFRCTTIKSAFRRPADCLQDGPLISLSHERCFPNFVVNFVGPLCRKRLEERPFDKVCDKVYDEVTQRAQVGDGL